MDDSTWQNLQVDGGITVRTAALAAAAGANEAVAGTAVFGAKDVRRAIRCSAESLLDPVDVYLSLSLYIYMYGNTDHIW